MAVLGVASEDSWVVVLGLVGEDIWVAVLGLVDEDIWMFKGLPVRIFGWQF